MISHCDQNWKQYFSIPLLIMCQSVSLIQTLCIKMTFSSFTRFILKTEHNNTVQELLKERANGHYFSNDLVLNTSSNLFLWTHKLQCLVTITALEIFPASCQNNFGSLNLLCLVRKNMPEFSKLLNNNIPLHCTTVRPTRHV